MLLKNQTCGHFYNYVIISYIKKIGASIKIIIWGSYILTRPRLRTDWKFYLTTLLERIFLQPTEPPEAAIIKLGCFTAVTLAIAQALPYERSGKKDAFKNSWQQMVCQLFFVANYIIDKFGNNALVNFFLLPST